MPRLPHRRRTPRQESGSGVLAGSLNTDFCAGCAWGFASWLTIMSPVTAGGVVPGRAGHVVRCRTCNGRWENDQRRGGKPMHFVPRFSFGNQFPNVSARVIRIATAARSALLPLSVGPCRKANKRVWTLSTLCLSDWGVHRSDRAGFGMIPGNPSVPKAWNHLRVPPRARHTPSSEGAFALTC